MNDFYAGTLCGVIIGAVVDLIFYAVRKYKQVRPSPPPTIKDGKIIRWEDVK
jgi:gas vesicle protein